MRKENCITHIDLKQIRQKNLADWFKTKTLPPKEKSYLSQLINGKTSFGERVSRRLEKDYGMPAFYLDSINKEHIDYITIELLDWSVPYGYISLNHVPNDTVRQIEIPKSKSALWFSHYPTTHLKLTTIHGDSMEPTLPQGSIAFVDSHIHELIEDGIYAFILKGEAYIKRLQRLPDTISVKSDNPYYESFIITPDQVLEKEIYIVGKLISVLPFGIKNL
ncbi:S24 family peptidase [Neisseriaceae bacterium ESL0693]|nr:S24 family peptidase [Neisseriaceae bacterium ESL0693]